MQALISKDKSKSEDEDPIPRELEGVLRPRKETKTPTIPNGSTPRPLEQVSNSEKDSAGSVLIEKVNEPLDADLKAYNSRIATLTELPKKLQEYPNPREEKINLAVH